MTDTVKINVGFFYNIKIYTVDFIYLLINVPNKSVTLVSIQNIWGGGERREATLWSIGQQSPQ